MMLMTRNSLKRLVMNCSPEDVTLQAAFDAHDILQEVDNNNLSAASDFAPPFYQWVRYKAKCNRNAVNNFVNKFGVITNNISDY